MNPFYQAMGGNRQPNMMQQFQSFMQQMRGKDPNAMRWYPLDAFPKISSTKSRIRPSRCRACLRGCGVCLGSEEVNFTFRRM